MGKKYLETKKDSLESSVLGVWKTAIEEGDARMDGRTKEYREHRKKLESARQRRESKKVNKEEVRSHKDITMVAAAGYAEKALPPNTHGNMVH